ncbi:MAG: hypothetical protein D3914_01150 [Candidatus Electrothrix sp. LOE2]|nr:hypothetical protein [Candidatus Electrothrix sp. LOE2]
MNKKVIIGYGFVILILFSAKNVFSITTDNTPSPYDLVTALLAPGITVSNITFAGVPTSAGMFSEGSVAIGFDKGIILSSGNIANVIGPNQQDGITQDNALAGDADLDALAGYSTYDATVLEFDFIVDSVPGVTLATVSFQYVFASDEYNEYVNKGVNDVFGFFVNGNNIALIPDTNTPISIDTVNSTVNSNFYINNDLQDGGGSIDTEMDGLTTVLTASVKVVPGETNHIKLAVADVGDSILDSNVFFKLGSFIGQKLVVTLASFSAIRYEGTVMLEWKTEMELDNAGFNIWRSETEAGEYTKINDSLLPAQGSEYQYSFTDDTAVKGKTYYYKLEDIDLNGTATFHGPVSTKRTHKGLLPAIRFLLRD